jgi:hypothetical protein
LVSPMLGENSLELRDLVEHLRFSFLHR